MMNELNNASFQAAMQFTDFFRDVAESEEEFGLAREELESDHITKMEEIRKRGLTSFLAIDEEGEQLSLRILEGRLSEAIEKQAEFDAETTDLEKARTEKSIRELEGQIAEKRGLIESANEGLVAIAGENTNALIAEEQRRHDAAIAGLDEEMRKTQELQDQKMGQLLLQTFDQWADVKDVPPEQMLEMRLAIAGEFDLISDEQALMVDGAMKKWDEWLASTDTTAAETVADTKRDRDPRCGQTDRGHNGKHSRRGGWRRLTRGLPNRVQRNGWPWLRRSKADARRRRRTTGTGDGAAHHKQQPDRQHTGDSKQRDPRL
jgi:hypothetical protein